jgi:hypothetical protein
MITIFSKKIGVFLFKKNMSYDQRFAKTASSLSKNAKFFAKNLLK